jgi:tetratricopeptide (TPR) repeat protein
MDPSFASVYWRVIPIYEQKGELDKAIEERQRASALGGENAKEFAREATLLHKAYATKGVRGYWLQEVEFLKTETNRSDPVSLACVYAQLGNKDQAFRVLEGALRDRFPNLIWELPASPDLDALRSDPRYLGLLRRLVPRSE